MPTTVRFVYTRSRYENGALLQQHNQVHEITVAADPLNYSGLREAERAFLTWLARELPGEDLMMWTAAYASGPGKYSEYRAWLPANA